LWERSLREQGIAVPAPLGARRPQVEDNLGHRNYVVNAFADARPDLDQRLIRCCAFDHAGRLDASAMASAVHPRTEGACRMALAWAPNINAPGRRAAVAL
jgi:hypothetical protein